MAAPVQAPLPGLPPGAGERWRKTFAWSVSKHRQWEHCRRAWFLDVVAPHMVRPPIPFHRLERLRRLASWGVVKGSAVHQALEAGLPPALQDRDGASAAHRALDTALRGLARHPEERLAEVANGEPFDAAALESLREEGHALVGRFFAEVWPRYRGRRYVQHERARAFQVRDHLVRVRVDLLTAGPEGLLITDWKTGRAQGDVEEDLQLSAYILWATKALGEPLERVRAELVYLADGSSRVTARSPGTLAKAEDRVVASAEAMLAVRGAEDAPPRPGVHCRGCGFAQACEAAAPWVR